MEFWGFLTASVLLTLLPGPDILFVLTQSITRGRKAGVLFAAGLCTGLIFHTAAVSGGLSLLLANSPVAFGALKVAGAAYLIYLGVKSFLQRNNAGFAVSSSGGSGGQLYRKGILMNLLNPKVVVFFIAFFPQFVAPETLHPGRAFLVMGLLFMVQAMLIFSAVAVLAGTLSHHLARSPRFSYYSHWAEALIYCVIGVSLFFVA